MVSSSGHSSFSSRRARGTFPPIQITVYVELHTPYLLSLSTASASSVSSTPFELYHVSSDYYDLTRYFSACPWQSTEIEVSRHISAGDDDSFSCSFYTVNAKVRSLWDDRIHFSVLLLPEKVLIYHFISRDHLLFPGKYPGKTSMLGRANSP